MKLTSRLDRVCRTWDGPEIIDISCVLQLRIITEYVAVSLRNTSTIPQGVADQVVVCCLVFSCTAQRIRLCSHMRPRGPRTLPLTVARVALDAEVKATLNFRFVLNMLAELVAILAFVVSGTRGLLELMAAICV